VTEENCRSLQLQTMKSHQRTQYILDIVYIHNNATCCAMCSTQQQAYPLWY